MSEPKPCPISGLLPKLCRTPSGRYYYMCDPVCRHHTTNAWKHDSVCRHGLKPSTRSHAYKIEAVAEWNGSMNTANGLPGPEKEPIKVQTPAGTLEISANLFDGDIDELCPGVVILLIDPNGKEKSAAKIIYEPSDNAVTLQAWSPDDPDGEPVIKHYLSKPTWETPPYPWLPKEE